MSRKAIATILAVYLFVALVFGFFQTFIDHSANDLRPAAWIGGTLGGTLGLLIIAGILPLLLWAFQRFRVEKADGPLAVWGILGVILIVLYSAGTLQDRQDAIGDLTSNLASLFDSDYGALVRGINRSCVDTQRKSQINRQASITEQQIHAYCQCYADAMGKGLTADDVANVAKNSDRPTAAVIEKANRIAPLCNRLALGR
jgi:hypothetical protein